MIDNEMLLNHEIMSDETIIFADIQDGVICGYYREDIHGDNIPSTAIPITPELHNKFLEVPRVGVPETFAMPLSEKALGVEYLDMFTSLGYEPIPIEDLQTEEEKQLEQLKAENQELKDRLDRLESAIQSIAIKVE